jgi:hypothetical protein
MTTSDQARFMAVLPSLRRVIGRSFRSYFAMYREDAIAEAIGIAWYKFRRLVERGGDPERFVSSIGQQSAVIVHRGRTIPIAGGGRGRAVIEPLCHATQRKYRLHSRPMWDECLITRPPIPEAVAFRIDFAAWRRQWTRSDLAIIDDRLAGYTRQEIACRMGLSKSAVEQRLPLFRKSWQQFRRVA